MNKNIFVALFIVLCVGGWAENANALGVSCSWLSPSAKAGVASADSKLKGLNCRERTVHYIQNDTTKEVSAVVECLSCYEGFTLTSKSGTADNACEDGYKTCVRDGSGSTLLLPCSSTSCPSSTSGEFRTVYDDPLSKFRGIGSSPRCYKTQAGSTVINAYGIVCDENYDDTYTVQFKAPVIGCGINMANCVPKYSSLCPGECPFLGWASADNHRMTRCVKGGTGTLLDYKCETSCEEGYRIGRSGTCVACTAGMICQVGKIVKCRAGYYGLTVPGTGDFACAECPSGTAEDGSIVKGKSSEGSLDITDCYLPSGKYKTTVGKYQLTGNCSYEL